MGDCVCVLEETMDWTSEEGQKLSGRLKQELVAWLTTVRSDGTPVPTPVWFLWDGNQFLIYTQPGSAKLNYIAGNPRAALNLNSDAEGGSVAVFTGDIIVATDVPAAIDNKAYLEKYRQGIADIQMTPESFSRDYSVTLCLHPEKIRAW
jgi:PPOX class probable F420-dependent enzyme